MMMGIFNILDYLLVSHGQYNILLNAVLNYEEIILDYNLCVSHGTRSTG
jgi:hypothetical protein